MAASANNDTQQRARLALVDMAKHQVPITPSNYSLWYEHVVRANPDLSTSIDGVLRDGKAPDNVVLQGLYTQFFETEPVDVDETSREISHTLRETLDSVRLVLNGAGDGLGEYGQSLDEFVTKSRSDPSPDSTLRMVKALVAQTASLKSNTDELRDNLSRQAEEVTALQAALARSQSDAETDHLTQLPNRKAFDAALSETCNNVGTDSHAPTLLIVDIDHFKSVNDTYGHLVGDIALQQIAKLLIKTVRGGDHISRWGGEEFSILLPTTPRSGALTVAEAIRSAIANEPIANDQGEVIIEKITVSIGVAWHRGNETFASFIDRADAALYRAKQGGRNQVVDENR